jgi:catechol 2,3-dioxygenase-like lactoylglutathione lyase family enzyme
MRSSGIHHVDLVVSDMDAALAFYGDVLGALGWEPPFNVAGERGETIHYLRGPGCTLGLRAAPDGPSGLPVDRYRVGLHHLCFEAPSPERLEAAVERVRAHRCRITDGPREMPEYGRGYVVVFLRDPDGLKLEICFDGRDRGVPDDVDGPGWGR